MNPRVFVTLVGLFLLFQLSSAQSQAIQNINASEMKSLISDNPGILLDVRTQQEIEKGFIKNAVFIDILESDFQEKVLKLPKDKPIYVYCWSGGRSADAAEFLQSNGYQKVYNLSGGINAWKSSGNLLEPYPSKQ